MTVKLIITENAQAASTIAFALGGIYDTDGTCITESERFAKRDALNRLKGKGYIYSKKNNDNIIIIWSKVPVIHKNSDLMSIYTSTGQFPYVPDKVEVELAENFSTILKKLITEKEIKEVYLAYSPCLHNAITAGSIASYLPKETHVKITCLEIPAYTKKYISDAFNSPISDIQLKSSYNRACRKKLLSWTIEENISLAFSVSQDSPYRLNEYILAVMALIYRRSNAINQRKYPLVAEIDLHGTKVIAISKNTYYKSEVDKYLKTQENYEAKFASPYSSNFVTTPDLFAFYGKNESGAELNNTMLSLFYKGYITTPFTLAQTLPSSFSDEDIKKLLHICSEVLNEKLTDDYIASVRKKITKNRERREYPIIPLSHDDSALTYEELSLYKYIVTKTLETIIDNSKHHYSLTINDIDFICEIPQNKSKLIKRGEKIFPATLVLGEEKRVTPYTPEELVHDIADRSIGIIDDYIDILDMLQATIKINMDQEQIYLEADAKKLYKALPTKAMKSIDIFESWEKAMENDAVADEALAKKDLQLTLAEWIPKILKMDELGLKKPPEKYQPAHTFTGEEIVSDPKPPIIRTDVAKEDVVKNSEIISTIKKEFPQKAKVTASIPTHCPNCKQDKLYENDHKYFCKKCGFYILKKIEFEQGEINVTQKDVLQLVQNKATGIKLATHKGTIQRAGILVLNNDCSISFTNKSKKHCPYCGESLEIFTWGMGCSECNFAVPYIIYGKKISAENYKDLLQGKRTSIINGLIAKDGSVFSASLKIDKDGNLKLYNE